MNKKTYQPIFRRDVVDQMRSTLRSGEALSEYFKEKIKFDKGSLLQSAIEVSGKAPILKIPKKNIVLSDVENAILLHEYYKAIDETQASDSRLWTYLSHIQFRKYAIARWGFGKSFKDFKDESEKIKGINYFSEHWFVNGNDRDLRRHALARLWWAAHLTYAPWEREPEFFNDLKKKDPYYYTKVLLSTQDIYQQVLERSMGRSPRILISILDYLDTHKKFADSRENIRALAKELNLVYGVKKIIALDRKSLESLIVRIATELTNNER